MISPSFPKLGIYVFLISLTSVYYLANAPILVGHYDLGWHLAAGDLIRQQGGVPFHDPWSFTAGDRQWFNLSWLWDVIASVLFQYSGFTGLLLFAVVWGAIITGYLAALGLRSGASQLAVCISVLSACLLYPAFSAYPNIYLTASPNATTMLFSVVFYGECLRQTKSRFLLPAVMILWANMHGGFLLGIVIVGAFASVALLRRDWTNFRIYSFVGVGCFGATFINPLGWHIYEGLTTVLGHFSQAYISEWWPYYRNITIPGSIPALIYILAFVALELRYRDSCPTEARLLSWLLLFLGIYQFRYMSFFFLFSTVPMALHLDRVLPKQASNLGAQRALLGVGTIAACALPLIYLQIDPAGGIAQMLPEQDVSYLQTHFPHARLLNHWNYGGTLIFRNRGAIPVFVDGRAATAYPDDLLRDYFKIGQVEVDEAAWDMVLAKYQIDTVLWVKAHEELRRFLVKERGWKESYTGSYVSIYAKP
jgi:MFS family permease